MPRALDFVRPPLLLALLLVISAGCGSSGDSSSSTSTPSGSGSTSTEGSSPNSWQQAMLDRVNAERSAGTDCASAKSPVSPLQWDQQLWEAAKRHADDMQNNSFFSHTGSDGSSVGQRVSDTGYSWSTVGENIAGGYTSVDAVMDAWMASSGHCNNIMNAAYTEAGFARSGNYWVQVFAKPSSSPKPQVVIATVLMPR